MGTMTGGKTVVTRVGDGVYRVETGGRAHLVYVAGDAADRWTFCDGEVFRFDSRDNGLEATAPRSRRRAAKTGPSTIIAPMPATVLKVSVKAGDAVAKGDVLVVLEAMKMELPLRATDAAIVGEVLCREGELVQADAVLVTLGSATP
jgi:acetyl/propionyl-CoA carboxylase alpha subunit